MVAMIKTFKVRGLVRVQNVWIKNLHCTRLLANGSAEAPFFLARVGKGLDSIAVGFPWLAVTAVFHCWGQGSDQRGSQDQQVDLCTG